MLIKDKVSHLLTGEEFGKVNMFSIRSSQLIQLPLGGLHVVQLVALEHS